MADPKLPDGAVYMTDEEIRMLDAKGWRDPEADKLKEEIKAAIAMATAGNMDQVIGGDDELHLELQARNVMALVWPKIKDRIGTVN